MTDITLTFTYPIQDDYLSQTFTEQRSAQYTYSGPNKIWVFIHNETGKIQNMNWFTEAEGGPDLEDIPEHTKVEIECGANPLACELIGSNKYEWDRADQEMVSIDLPDGTTYEYPKYPEPNHTYTTEDMTYNFETGKFDFIPLENWRDWDQISELINNKLERVELQESRIADFPASLQTALSDYKSKLQSFLTDWADIPPHAVKIPENPIDNS